MNETMVKMKLVRPHTHAGIDYAAGNVIEVPPDTANWLIGAEIAEKEAAAPAKSVQVKASA